MSANHSGLHFTYQHGIAVKPGKYLVLYYDISQAAKPMSYPAFYFRALCSSIVLVPFLNL